jgi:predicted RecA/RadA family phage recombinase
MEEVRMESCPFDNLFRSVFRLPKAEARQIGDDLDSGVVWPQSTADRMNHGEKCYWERIHDMN